ncbi:hypothetical protein D3C76_1576550 [compost metagenome]
MFNGLERKSAAPARRASMMSSRSPCPVKMIDSKGRAGPLMWFSSRSSAMPLRSGIRRSQSTMEMSGVFTNSSTASRARSLPRVG